MGLINRLKEDHKLMLALVGEMEEVLTRITDPLDLNIQGKLRNILHRLIEFLQSHGQLEKDELFAHLRGNLLQSDKWRVAMMETHDEMILDAAQNLHLLVSDACASIPAERLKESGTHLCSMDQGACGNGGRASLSEILKSTRRLLRSSIGARCIFRKQTDNPYRTGRMQVIIWLPRVNLLSCWGLSCVVNQGLDDL